MASTSLRSDHVVGLHSHNDAVKPTTNTTAIDVEKGQTQIASLGKDGAATIQVEAAEDPSAAAAATVIDLEEYPAPTPEERKTLRKVSGSVPWTAWTLCVVELAERASYYGVKAVFNNYLQFPLPEGGDGSGAIDPARPNSHAGALGLGLRAASALTLLFTFLAYVIPVFGAWWADTRVGRYPAIVYGVLIGGVAHVIMSNFHFQVGGAAPAILKAGQGVAPFLVSFFVLAIGAGIFKPNVAPTLLDQYRHQREYTKVLESGEKVLVDPETTVSHLLLIFYAVVNVGAFFSIAVVYIEKYHGFWLAFLAPGLIYFLLPFLLAAMYKRTIRKKPVGSDLTRFVKITTAALKKSKGNIFSKHLWHNVKPSTLAESGQIACYSEKDVSDAQRTWEAVQIFLYFPIWYINDGGVGSLQSNQGAAMTTSGAPNDLLTHFNPLTIIVVSPLMGQVVYPYLRRKGIKFGRIDRMTFGFALATISGVIGAIVQYKVYETSPCGYQASTCDGVSPIPIWWQIPNVSLGAASEVFVNVTAYELAYARAPENMRATVIAIFLFMISLGSALGEILIPALADPTLVWAWAAPAVALFLQTVVFWWRHRHVNEDAFMTYEEDFRPSFKERSSSSSGGGGGGGEIKVGEHDDDDDDDEKKKEG